jgi:hypothetical protein
MDVGLMMIFASYGWDNIADDQASTGASTPSRRARIRWIRRRGSAPTG